MGAGAEAPAALAPGWTDAPQAALQCSRRLQRLQWRLHTAQRRIHRHCGGRCAGGGALRHGWAAAAPIAATSRPIARACKPTSWPLSRPLLRTGKCGAQREAAQDVIASAWLHRPLAGKADKRSAALGGCADHCRRAPLPPPPLPPPCHHLFRHEGQPAEQKNRPGKLLAAGARWKLFELQPVLSTWERAAKPVVLCSTRLVLATRSSHAARRAVGRLGG